MDIKGKNVLITGGASGIGRIMGRICLEKGAAQLVIWDINERNIRETVDDFVGKGFAREISQDAAVAGDAFCCGKLYHQVVNVADAGLVREAYGKIRKEVGAIDILINCAGVVRGNNTFDSQSVSDIDLTMNINASAPMYVALNVLPDMIRRDCGTVCNIASAAGMLGVPKLSVYCASKWAVIGWTESMRIELKMMKSHVKVLSVAPYFINTGMFDGVNSKVFPILKPERAASKIIRAIEKGVNFRGIPFPYHFIRFWQGILPNVLFDFIFGKCFGVYEVMDHFTGRKPLRVASESGIDHGVERKDN